MPVKSPYQVIPKSPLLRLLSPATIGTLTAATFALYPKAADGTLKISRLDRWENLWSNVPGPVYGVLIGFVLGFGVIKGLQVLRWKLLRALLAYTGWVYNPKSWKVKGWAILLKLVKGPSPHPTYFFQDVLPKQPLPPLNATLDTWLTVNETLLSKDEFAMTRQAVEDFRKNEGPKVQKYLEERAKQKVNWVSDYWLQAAYLASRAPTAINNNYATMSRTNPDVTTDPIVRLAVHIRLECEFQAMIEKKELEPILTQDLVPFCMNGFTHIFCTNRDPGEHMDSLTKYPNSKHILFIRNGHYFKLDMYAEDSAGKMTLLTCEEIGSQIQRMCDIADGLDEEPSVAALTSQNRTVWYKQRQQLKLKNAEVLHTVESAMFVACLDPASPKDYSELSKSVLTGRGNDRWFDKCFTSVVFNNTDNGNNVEHSMIDAMVFANLGEYCLFYESIKCRAFDYNKPMRKLATPKRLTWDVNDLKDEIATALKSYTQVVDDLDIYACQTKYGKGFMKKCRVSPDGYTQMCMQLAYYRMHNEIPKTYEPSTGRLFARGRTDTVHPVSTHSVSFVKSMDDPTVDNATKVQQFKQAVKHQAKFRLQATMGKGCDRHLLALYCASREMGMDVPTLFRDKAWQMPFKLSTSNVPIRVYELRCEVDLPACSGVFGPSTQDGYGVCYVLISEDIVIMRIASWKSAKDTDSVKLGDAIQQAFEDVKKLFLEQE